MSNLDTVEEVLTDRDMITDVEFREVATEPAADVKPMSIVETIVMLMEEANVVDTQSWMTGLPEEAKTSPDLNVQRFLVNRHWRFLLTNLPTIDEVKQTINARGCLQDGRWELSDWIMHFKKDVIPCAIKVKVLAVKDQDESTKSDSTNSPTES